MVSCPLSGEIQKLSQTSQRTTDKEPRTNSPPHECGAPCEAAAETAHHEQVVAAEAAGAKDSSRAIGTLPADVFP